MGRSRAKKPVAPSRISGKKMPRRLKPRLFDWRTYDPSMAPHQADDLLADELMTYRNRLQELLKDPGRFVLIKGHEVIGIYESREEALQQSINRFQQAPALVKQIVAKEPVRDFGGVAL
jgi:hypothetical protein